MIQERPDDGLNQVISSGNEETELDVKDTEKAESPGDMCNVYTTRETAN